MVMQPAVLVVVVPAEAIVVDQESEVSNANITLEVLGAGVNCRTRDLCDL